MHANMLPPVSGHDLLRACEAAFASLAAQMEALWSTKVGGWVGGWVDGWVGVVVAPWCV